MASVMPTAAPAATSASLTSAASVLVPLTSNPSTPNFTPLVHQQNGQVVPGAPADPNLTQQNAGVLNTIIDNLLNTEATSQKDLYSSTAEQQTSTGDLAEGEAYNNAAAIAAGNADIAAASGQIQQFQAMRKAVQTIGEQKAVVAGAGFGDSGSALLLAQDSMRQAHLQDQIIGENSQLQEGGFLEQAQASTATGTAATTASSAALTLAQGDASASTLLQSDANAEAEAVSAAFPGTPQANIALNAATGTPLSPADLAQQAATLTGQTLGPTNTLKPFSTGWLSLL